MKTNIFILIICLSIFSQFIYSQNTKSDANIVGHVKGSGEHLPFASVAVKGATIGTSTDETGHYRLIDLPPGEHQVVVSIIGFKPQEKKVTVQRDQTTEMNFELEEDVLNIEEVVISADRSEQKRKDANVIVNTISPELFNSTQSITMGEGLNFSPGLRLENNCQNCGFTQVRMNGMEGPYSQVLINSRPVFSGLAGVYGLELIPANMIEKVEVIRGGGSALYGSNAIAGTINIILKDPVRNTYEIGSNYSLTGALTNTALAPDYSLNFNTSLVSDDHKTGVTLYGYSRERELYDANNDGFSEIAPLNNLTLGTRFYHRFGLRSKLTLDFFNIKEERNGGNKQELPLHERDIAEVVGHDMKTAAMSWERYFRDYDLLTVYISSQFLKRDSYYGANRSLSDYGMSKDNTYNLGTQYKALFDQLTVVSGIENTGGFLIDKKLGYPDINNAVIQDDSIIFIPHAGNTTVANQQSVTSGAFTQFEYEVNNFSISVGARYDHYEITNKAKEGHEPVKGDVFSPRLSVKYKVFEELQARISYSQGYRAPQIFDEDLHIETSGSRQVTHENASDLKQEKSHSLTTSIDYNGLIGTVYTGFLLEGFYTRLEDPFVHDIGLPDEEGRVVYRRMNAEDGATVKGINLEFKFRTLKDLSLTSGLTVQSSRYDEKQDFNERKFFRTPDRYGYFVIDYDIKESWCFSATGNYTGTMLVPYFGTETDPESGELRESTDFMDLGAKIKYTRKLNGASLQFFAGVKNILNAYQSDFDTGIDRDPAYMYGPVLPRTVYFGVRFGNLLK